MTIHELERDLETTQRTRKRTPKNTPERTALWNREKELERELTQARQQELEELRKEPPQTCLLCAHCRWNAGDHGYSEVTPGYEWWCTCIKGHFSMEGAATSEREYRGNLLRARSCPDFELSPEAGDILRENNKMDSEKAASAAVIAANADDLKAFLDDVASAYRKHGMALDGVEPEVYRKDAKSLARDIEVMRRNLFCACPK